MNKTKVSTPVTVTMLADEFGTRFIVHYSIEIPTGENDFNDMVEVIDREVNAARMEIVKKVAKKFGVEVAFSN